MDTDMAVGHLTSRLPNGVGRAMKKMDALRKKGVDIQPVEIDGRKIAKTFWGEAWCDHLESFSDFENRLPRGRTYVRNGSVCHLAIAKGQIEAKVSGSELYNVKVDIKTLPGKKWTAIKGRCSGQIGSLLELLQGRLSDHVMEVVTDRKEGLFPLPGEMSFKCSCPDWAVMCKHVAAVLYGVGARLDTQARVALHAARREPRGTDRRPTPRRPWRRPPRAGNPSGWPRPSSATSSASILTLSPPTIPPRTSLQTNQPADVFRPRRPTKTKAGKTSRKRPPEAKGKTKELTTKKATKKSVTKKAKTQAA